MKFNELQSVIIIPYLIEHVWTCYGDRLVYNEPFIVMNEIEWNVFFIELDMIEGAMNEIDISCHTSVPLGLHLTPISHKFRASARCHGVCSPLW